MIQLSVCSSDELSQGIYESVRPSGGKSRSRQTNGDPVLFNQYVLK